MPRFKESQGLGPIPTAAHPKGSLVALAETAPMGLSGLFVGYNVAVLVG